MKRLQKDLKELQQLVNEMVQLQAELEEIRSRKDEPNETPKQTKVKTTRDLIKNICKSTKTMALLDEFEGIGKYVDKEAYDRLIITGFTGYTKLGNITCQYIIKRMDYEDETVGNITFTELKNGKCTGLKKYVTEQIENKIKSMSYDERVEIDLDMPYLLRAQNSKNREGYGWEWDWSYGVGSCTEGTYYGETTRYGIVGIRVTKYL